MKNVKSSAILLLGIFLMVNACTSDKAEELQDCSLLEEISLLSSTNSSCGEASGFIEVASVVSTEFEGTVLYSINGSAATASSTFENLEAGNYEVSAQISDECTKSISVVVDNEAGLNVAFTSSDSDCGDGTGAIEITPSDAVGTVSYKLDGGAAQTTGLFQNLSPGTYNFVATDDAGCEVNQEVKISSVISASDIQSITSTNCAVPNCHGGNVQPNLTSVSDIESAATRMVARTSANTMPPAGSGFSLTAAQIEEIACWANDL